LYRLSLRRCFGSRGSAGARRVSIVPGSMMLKLALGASHRLASRSRCCRLGSAGRRSVDFTMYDEEVLGAQNRVATLRVTEQMAMMINPSCHPRSPILRCFSNCM